MNIGIIGLGLIGGSLARSIREHSAHTVYGRDLNEDVVRAALDAGAIHGALTDERLPECDVLLAALYPQTCVRVITEIADRIAPHALVIDCAGVKRAVCEPLEALAAHCPWTYIGGHPMAGRERSGFESSMGTLFERASMILTPSAQTPPDRLEQAKAFFLEIGFRSVRITTPFEHDQMIAYTSQLAHIVSGAYVKNPLSYQHRGFSAGSFQDMTRVARLKEDMWTELFLDNADLLIPTLDDLILRLSEYRKALADADAPAVTSLLREGRLCKEALD